jgi:hypothetical protein
MGLTKQQAVSVFPDGCIGMRNITPPLSTLLEGCEQLPARAVRAMGATSGVIGSMQPGALCMLVVYAKTTPAGDECQLPADFAESYGIRATKVLTTREAPAWWVAELLLRRMVHTSMAHLSFVACSRG